MFQQFRNRTEAGQQLAARLSIYANRPDVLVLGLPRGGVPVAFEVAVALNAPLDVFLVRKLGVHGREELALGAIASGGILVLNQDVIQSLSISQAEIERVVAYERKELERRERIFCGNRPCPSIQGRTVIVIDDGLATGATMFAAVRALRQASPAHIIVAVPVAPRETCEALDTKVDGLLCLVTPAFFYAISPWYEDFRQTTDAEVCQLLTEAERRKSADRLEVEG